MDKKSILFTSIGRRVELIQMFRAAAKEMKKDVIIYGADSSEDAAALFFCDEKLKVCGIKEKEYIPMLINFCRKKQVSLLIPTIDTDLLLLAENRMLFENIGTKVLISNADSIKICRDKRFTADFFLQCGCQSPVTVDNVDSFQGNFPCFIKPRDGSSSKNAFMVRTEKELHLYAGMISEYIIQPYIKGREYTVDILCDFEGNPIYITPRERLAVRGGEVLKTAIRIDGEMIKECIEIIAQFKPCGPITVQCIKEEETGENYYIEINPRFGGGAPCSMMAGANSAAAILALLSSSKLQYNANAARNNEVYSRFDQSVCMNAKSSELVEIYNLQDIEELVKEEEAILFDLDDTLYLERDYVKSGFRKIEKFLTQVEHVYEKLWGYFQNGQSAIDELLKQEGIYSEELKKECLTLYRKQIPDIELLPGSMELLKRLREEKKKIGILTDGRVEGQMRKLESLGLKKLVDEIVVTDELAGNSDVMNFRKPNDIAFRVLKERFQLPYNKMVYIGDNIAKDFKAPMRLGMKSIWYRNTRGLYYSKINRGRSF